MFTDFEGSTVLAIVSHRHNRQINCGECGGVGKGREGWEQATDVPSASQQLDMQSDEL